MSKNPSTSGPLHVGMTASLQGHFILDKTSGSFTLWVYVNVQSHNYWKDEMIPEGEGSSHLSGLHALVKGYQLPLLFAGALITISFSHFLAFHTLAELFSVGVAIMMFVVVWHTYQFSKNHFLMFLGLGYLWIGVLDVIHTLLYSGMPTAMDHGNMATQFWVATRYLESLLLFASPLFIHRELDRNKAVTVFGLIAILAAGAIFGGLFPDAFIEGEGLTTFKVVSEYIIVTILAGAIYHLSRNRQYIDTNIYYLMVGSLVLTIIAELAFTFYVSVYGISNLVGHIFKIFSFWLIYKGIIRTSLVAPFRALSHELQTVNTLHRQAQQLAKLGHWSMDLATWKIAYSDEACRIFDIDKSSHTHTYEEFLSRVHDEDRQLVGQTLEDGLISA